ELDVTQGWRSSKENPLRVSYRGGITYLAGQIELLEIPREFAQLTQVASLDNTDLFSAGFVDSTDPHLSLTLPGVKLRAAPRDQRQANQINPDDFYTASGIVLVNRSGAVYVNTTDNEFIRAVENKRLAVDILFTGGFFVQ
ncbi:MAG: hypothetical protein ACFCBV_10605, partial [Phycisphaerales bacterium]